ncbi:hypothetical protein QJS04_geneDACA012698 [Acorus gramineus]|uniref:CRIB domain-containing protein n=1 Tax=Acorus gramineus TaxID=55184 RepID=A0AAV9B4F0_ACOGR|nr:hypothetical protein QJS04_geneDACA012698 [Acorus gramineus]
MVLFCFFVYEGGDECTTQAPKTKTSIGLLPMERLQRLIKGFKSLSHLFYNDDDDEDNDNEMEIGLPTDVLHVGHIGCDNPNALPSMINGWDFPITAPPPPPTDLPFLSLGQFELAMARQATVLSPARRSA